MVWDTLLIDGVDTSNLFAVVEDFDVYGAAGVRGSNYTVPGRHGSVWVQKPREELTVSLGIAVLATDPVTGVEPVGLDAKVAQLNANWLAITRLVKPRRRLLELSRRISLPNGEQTTITAAAEHPGELRPSRLGASALRTVLTFRLPLGIWLDETYSTFNIPSGVSTFIPVSGSTDTATVLIELTASVAGVQTLTNVSAGVSLSYNWGADRLTSTVRVDAGGFTVRRYPPGLPYVSSLAAFKHSGDPRYMILDPDLADNEFTLNTGSAVLNYRGAWL